MAEKSTIARPYARAIFDLASSQGRLAEWSDMLGFCACVAGDAEIQALIGNPRVGRERLADLILGICEGRLDQPARNMVQVLIENHRLGLLPEIHAQFEVYKAEAEKVIQAQVITAYELDKSQQQQIAAALKKRLGREVEIQCRVDASLLGGAIIRAGDLVIDGSVTGQLGRLTNVLAQ